MPLSLQVLYPTDGDTTFDHPYYAATHMAIVDEHMAPHAQSITVTKGVAGGGDSAPGFHAIATFLFADQAALDAAMGAAGPALEDIPKFYSGAPVVLVGETI